MSLCQYYLVLVPAIIIYLSPRFFSSGFVKVIGAKKKLACRMSFLFTTHVSIVAGTGFFSLLLIIPNVVTHKITVPCAHLQVLAPSLFVIS